jgi:ribosomal protein S6--L-glutamate ligase
MNVYVMLAFRRVSPAPNPVLVEVFETLERRGHTVEVGIAEELILDPQLLRPNHDLYLLKSHAPLWLSLAAVLHAQGARLLNPFLGCRALQDKVQTARTLREGGVPAPASWVTGDLHRLQAIAAEHPLIIKPYDGGRAEGIHMARNPRELASLPRPERPMLVQKFVPNDGTDLKLYVVGSEVFGVRKPSPLLQRHAPSQPWPVSDEVRQLALRCGELFNLTLYGVDLVEGPDGPVVVDVNYFPSFRPVPGAAALIADCVEQFLPVEVSAHDGIPV